MNQEQLNEIAIQIGERIEELEEIEKDERDGAVCEKLLEAVRSLENARDAIDVALDICAN